MPPPVPTEGRRADTRWEVSALRFGISGCGVIGAIHAQAIASVATATLVGVADIAEAMTAASRLAAKYGVPAYEGLDVMLETADLDAVCICTPSGLHASQLVKVMQHGRDVLVEKPMAMTTGQADAIVALSQETGRTVGVVSQHRFDPAAALVKRLLDEELFGRVALGVAHVPWWRAQSYYDKAAWRGTATLDGGVLMNQAIHSIDLLQWLVGPIQTVQGDCATIAHEMETEDTAVATLRTKNGALGVISATTAAFPEHATRIEVLGDRGSAVIVEDRLSIFPLRGLMKKWPAPRSNRDSVLPMPSRSRISSTPSKIVARPRSTPSKAANPLLSSRPSWSRLAPSGRSRSDDPPVGLRRRNFSGP